ncbi:MAG: DUF4433 domain-containing protein [Henriciella sp.]|uniref:type II toxin-antitoxin system toxin DNA ADP-ribosyl transferase DarT n=1 Tax=Henriciella sp. TaxID=1968823 RepID=UPI0032EFF5B4
MPVPPRPKIYHIVHLDKLASIAADGFLFSDAIMADRGGAGTTIGMSGIKQMRLGRPVACLDNAQVGQFVPFYFCSRSLMLYVIHRANHPQLSYKGGQNPIVHLECDLFRTVQWAVATERRWAVSTINAAHGAAEFFADLGQLNRLDWAAISTHSWASCRDQKQAEFLIEDAFDWKLVDRIGVINAAMAQQVSDTIATAAHRPDVQIMRDWYY